MNGIEIKVDTLTSRTIANFLEEHIYDMHAVSPPESVHALDLDGLRKPNITFWSMWNGKMLVGCGALKEITREHGEIKSMRTSGEFRGKGLASKMLAHIIDQAKARRYKRLSLETGSMEFFKPAVALYEKFHFIPCEPFDDYVEDPNSVFMTRVL